MQWKERTMKAKWVWATWAYLTAVLVIVLQVLFLTFNNLYILPKFQKLTVEGLVDETMLRKFGVSWMVNFLNGLHSLGRYTTQILLVAVAAWGVLEWRVKSENKPFIRLSVLGTVSVVLTVVVSLMAGSLVILLCLGMPSLAPISRPWAIERITTIDTSLAALEQALAQHDWAAMQEQEDQASNALERLSMGPALSSLASGHPSATVKELRADVKAASEELAQARKALREKDEEGLKTTLRKFHQSFERVREAAKRETKSSNRR
jgi:hypothetical protein